MLQARMPLTLRLVEAQDLPQMLAPELRERFARGETGVVWSSPHDLSASALEGLLGGPDAAAWPYDITTPPHVDVPVFAAIGESWWFPSFGALIGVDGALYNPTIGGVRPSSPDLSVIPGVTENAGRFLPPADAPEIEHGAVFMPWGGTFNYGHFVIDALPSLLLLEQAGLLDDAPVLAPTLSAWQRDLIAMAFPGREVVEVEAPVVRLKRATFATSMDHFLHRPNGLVADIAARVLEQAPAAKGVKRVYLSRRGQSMRVMVGEAAFERALAARGFTIVRPETLSAGEQVALVRDAQVLVGASGAALANALFLPRGARVVEIQPLNFTSQWVRAACRQVGVDWRGYVCASPCPARMAPLLARLRRGFKFAFRPPLDDLLAFVDAAL
jgi:capsular polysaccharide biosynthesis protein